MSDDNESKPRRKRFTHRKVRNRAAIVARMRNSAGPMKDRADKRKARNSWRREEEERLLEEDGVYLEDL